MQIFKAKLEKDWKSSEANKVANRYDEGIVEFVFGASFMNPAINNYVFKGVDAGFDAYEETAINEEGLDGLFYEDSSDGDEDSEDEEGDGDDNGIDDLQDFEDNDGEEQK